MKGKRGLEGRLSFLACPPAEHMARSGGNGSYFGAEQRRAKQALAEGFILEEALPVLLSSGTRLQVGRGMAENL